MGSGGILGGVNGHGAATKWMGGECGFGKTIVLVMVLECGESGEMVVAGLGEEMVGCAAASNIQRTLQIETEFQREWER